jgi:hypothetical protein
MFDTRPVVNRHFRHCIAVLCLVVGLGTEASAGDGGYYFLRDQDFGTDAIFSPASNVLNLGFDITRSNSYPNSFQELDLQTGLTNTLWNLTHPGDTIERYGGFGEFFAHEFFPYKDPTNPEYTQWVPNYTLHLLGQGMVSRKMTEWYTREGYSHPQLWTIGTMLTSALLNETVENNAYKGGNTDPIADFYFFNPMGILLFSFDPVANFFSSTVQLEFWPGQPALVLNELGIYNAAENYSVRIDPGLIKGVRVLLYGGTEGLGGLSFDTPSGLTWSVAAGYRKIELKPVYRNGTRMYVPHESRGNTVGALFVERNGSLLASLKLDVGFDPAIRTNIYPGILKLGGVHVGHFLWASKTAGMVTGITFGTLPIGFGLSNNYPLYVGDH